MRRVAFVRNREIKLSATEHRLLWVLLRAKGNVMTHQQLLREVWGAAYVRDARLFARVHASLARKAGSRSLESRAGY